MKILMIILAVIAGLYLLHRLLLAAESRGWIFYRQRPPRVHFTGFLEELVQPSVEYLVEEESSEAIRADHAESGRQVDPEDPG